MRAKWWNDFLGGWEFTSNRERIGTICSVPLDVQRAYEDALEAYTAQCELVRRHVEATARKDTVMKAKKKR